MLIVGVVLIAEDMGVLLVCNLLQSQGVNTQTDVSESRVASVDSLSLGLPERQVMRDLQAIPLMSGSSGLGWV